jgi:hypothetical protein
MTRRTALLLALVLPALFAVGCNKERKPLFSVRGQVVWNNKPLPQAFVVLHPVGGAGEVRPSGRTDEHGQFKLTTYSAADGAPAGEYAVTVEWRKSVNTLDEGNLSLAPNMLPARYGRPDTTPLRVQIAEGANDLGVLRIVR